MAMISPAERFKKLGVDTRSPGFYDDAAFVAAEKDDPAILEEYAAFVCQKAYSVDYLARARHIIAQATEFMYRRLSKEKQLGRCIDASMVLSRFLERQAVWNYAAKGALTIIPPPASKLPSVNLAPIVLKGNPAKAGHVWLYAPPYVVVDLTVSLQPFPSDVARYLPKYVLAESATASSFDALDLMDPDGVEQFFRFYKRPPTLQDIERLMPGFLSRIDRFGAVEMTVGETRLRYITPAVSAPLEPLEGWRNLKLDGKYPIDLYGEFVASLNA